MPVVIIKLRNVTLINLYNEFTLHSYTNESTKLTKQLDQVRKSIENTSHIGKRVYWIGDVNIDLINSPLANSFINFCDTYGIKIENWNATREKACLDHILNLRASVHSIQILESYVSDHSIIVFKPGKKTSLETCFSKIKRLPDQEMAC